MSVPLYQATEFFKTLGHPARIRILELLTERDHAVHELLERIPIEPSNLSQQLAVLRRTSLVTSKRVGAEVVYSVSVPEVRDLLMAARSILSGLIAAQGEARVRAHGAAHGMTGATEHSSSTSWAHQQWTRVRQLAPRRSDWTSVRLGRDLPAGLMVGLVALPLALGFPE